jgi:hypothetical protein
MDREGALMNSRNPMPVGLVLGAAFAVCLAGGCGEDSELPEYDQISGRVSNIDKASGEVAMSYHSEKHQKDMELRGRLAPEAEIFINGVTARLDDVQVGDQVRVLGRVEKRESERNWVALKVEIDRRASATKPASSPAAK